MRSHPLVWDAAIYGSRWVLISLCAYVYVAYRIPMNRPAIWDPLTPSPTDANRGQMFQPGTVKSPWDGYVATFVGIASRAWYSLAHQLARCSLSIEILPNVTVNAASFCSLEQALLLRRAVSTQSGWASAMHIRWESDKRTSCCTRCLTTLMWFFPRQGVE